jgi:hypothetical protein
MEILKTVQEQLQAENMIPVYTGIAAVASVAALQLLWWQQHRKVRVLAGFRVRRSPKFINNLSQFERTFGKATYRPKFDPMGALGVLFGNGLTFTWKDRFTCSCFDL